MNPFEELQVWQKAMQAAVDIYQLTETFSQKYKEGKGKGKGKGEEVQMNSSANLRYG